MPTSFSCQRPFPIQPPSESPLPAERSADLEPALRILHSNKKPGDERRACTSTRFGRVLAERPPGRICSKLVVLVPGARNQPHLNLWAVPVRQTTPRRFEVPPTSKQYTHFSCFVKPSPPVFQALTCGFPGACGKCHNSVPSFSRGFGHRTCTSPERVIAATNGGLTRLHIRCIFRIA